MNYTLKSDDLERRAREALVDLFTRFPALHIDERQWVERTTGFPSDPGFDLTQLVTTKSGEIWALRAEIKSAGHPSQVRHAVLSLKRRANRSSDPNHPVYPLLIAPFLSVDAVRICVEEEVGCLDLSGNCHLEFDGVLLHIEGKPNQFKETRGLKTLYSPKATRVLRVLMQGPLREHLVDALAKKAGVSLGLVSKVRKHLLEEEFATVGEKGIRLTQPENLLKNWIQADRLEKRVELREYSLLESDHGQVAKVLHRFLGETKHAFTQWTAAHLRQPHVPPQVTSVYVEAFPDEPKLKEALKARRVDKGGRLRLFVPKDDGVFHGSQEIAGIPLVSDIQIYLDLSDAGNELRAGEAAEELRRRDDFAGGWRR